MNNSRFAINVHIMVILALNPQKLLSSEFISTSVNINPVIIRKELLFLQKAGLVYSKKGKYGGCYLARDSKEIKISEIYLSLSNSDIMGRKHQANPQCPIGRKVEQNLSELFKGVEQHIIQYLGEQNLYDFTQKFV